MTLLLPIFPDARERMESRTKKAFLQVFPELSTWLYLHLPISPLSRHEMQLLCERPATVWVCNTTVTSPIFTRNSWLLLRDHRWPDQLWLPHPDLYSLTLWNTLCQEMHHKLKENNKITISFLFWLLFHQITKLDGRGSTLLHCLQPRGRKSTHRGGWGDPRVTSGTLVLTKPQSP